MIAAVDLPLEFERQLHDEALRAFARECCGLIEGTIDGGVARVTALHPMPNVADEHDRFEIDPAAHIALLRNLRDCGHAIIGCYHSHPNGRAEPSERDRESAVEPDFLWLICAVEMSSQTTRIAAFVSISSSFSQVPIVEPRAPVARLDRAIPPASPKASSVAETRAIPEASLDRFAAPLL
jgi:proteasome lid subunit RPN8/RPN11